MYFFFTHLSAERNSTLHDKFRKQNQHAASGILMGRKRIAINNLLEEPMHEETPALI